MRGYIYKLTNKINGKGYVGLTTLTPQQRFESHLGSSKDDSPYVIHRAIRKYGIDNFSLEVLEEIQKEEKSFLKKKLAEREIFYIKNENTHYINGYGYNMTTGGEGVVGKPYTVAQKQMRSRQFKKLWESKEYSDKVLKGVRKFWDNNEEARKNMSVHSSSRERSKEQLKAMSEGYHTFLESEKFLERNKRISKTKSGIPMKEETKKKISKATIGKKKSEHMKFSLSKTNKALYETSEEYQERISSLVERAHTPEANKKRSESKRRFDSEHPDRFKGSKNPNAKKIIYVPENIIFNTRNEAAEYAGCHPTSIRRMIIDPNRNDWDYYNGEIQK